MSDTTNWIDRFQASVSWGDDIHTALLPSGTPYCWVEVEGQRLCWVPGSLGDLHATIALAQQVLATADCSGAIALFLDEAATAYQVEEACHALGRQGVRCDFLELQPRALYHDLLRRRSEGTLLGEAAPNAPIHTAADLDRIANDYIERTLKGGLGPGSTPDADAGALVRKIMSDQEKPEEDRAACAFLGGAWQPDDNKLGQRILQFAACVEFREQIEQYQLVHQISGLVEKPFEFAPLGFATTELHLGLWLEPLGDDLVQLRQAAQRNGQEFITAADGAGDEWLRYRRLNFTADNGTEGCWRYVRDSWSDLDAVLGQANSACFWNGISEIEGSADAVLELTIWAGGSRGGATDGDAHDFLLVHPSLADQLDAPDAWWA